MRQAHHIRPRAAPLGAIALPLLLGVLLGVLTASCARSPSSLKPRVAPSQAVVPPTQQPPDLAWSGASALVARATSADALRRQVDARGALSLCAALPSTDSHGQDAWVRAWCALRTNKPQALWRHAGEALRHMEELGHLRRQVELHLMLALASDQGGQPALSQDHHGRAQALMHDAALGWTASSKDAHGGDLPYLAGLLTHQRDELGVALEPGARPLSALGALALAAEEYHSLGRPHARAHALRALARVALDEGELSQAAHALDEAILQAPQADALAQSALVFADMALSRGQDDEAAQAERWLVHHHGPEVFGAPLHLSELPAQPQQLRQRWRTREQRLALLRAVRSLRRDGARALRPPPGFIKALRALDGQDLASLRADAWALAYELGLLLHERGHDQEARRLLERAVALIEQVRAAAPTLELRQRFLAQRREVYITLIHTVVGVQTERLTQGDYMRALSYASALKARGLLELLDGSSPSPAPSPAPPPLGPEQDAAALMQMMRHHLRGWSSSTPEAGQARPALPRASAALPALPQRAALVEYLIGQRAGYIWVLRDDGQLHMRRIAGRQMLGPLVERFMALAAQPGYDQATLKAYRELAERLYVELLGPVQDLIASREHLILAPDAALEALPFEALARPSREASPRALVRDFSLSYVPSGRVLASLQAKQRPSDGPTPQGALLMGSPTLHQLAGQLAPWGVQIDAPRAKLSTLMPSLPGAVQELRAASALLRARGHATTLRLGDEATRSSLEHVASAQAPRRLALLHLATHGLTDAKVEREPALTWRAAQPALLLTPAGQDDGVLALEHILASGLGAQLVVLSGCATGRGWRTLGDGAHGLAGAFLVTGSRAVIASAWSVPDSPTALLMRRFYARLAQGAPAADALRAAQLELLRQGQLASGAWLPPYYWAAFRVIGDAAP